MMRMLLKLSKKERKKTKNNSDFKCYLGFNNSIEIFVGGTTPQ